MKSQIESSFAGIDGTQALVERTRYVLAAVSALGRRKGSPGSGSWRIVSAKRNPNLHSNGIPADWLSIKTR